MSGEIKRVLRSDMALASLDHHLIKQARVLYQMRFFKEITAAQMAAVAEYIQSAPDHSKAQEKTTAFLGHQLKKLNQKAERTSKPESWASLATGGSKESLGETLIHWIKKEQYLMGVEIPENLDHLAALQHFWSRFHDLYRYQKEMSKGMTLREPQEDKEQRQ